MARKRIVIIGAGGMAREINWLIRDVNAVDPIYEILGYVVSDLNRCGKYDSRAAVLGDYSWLEENRRSIDAFAVGIGSPAARLRVGFELCVLLPDAELPPLIHPSVILDRGSARIARGAQLCAGTVATVNITVEALALCNFGCTLGHEVVIGEGSVVNPGANISGGAILGRGVLVGTGAQVLQYCRVGDGAIVGAGAVVRKNVAPWTTVVGVPACAVTSRAKLAPVH